MNAVIVFGVLSAFLGVSDGAPNKKACSDPPHSDKCLLNKWLYTGCSADGTAAPPFGAKTEEWRNMTIHDMKKEMSKVRKRAMRGWTVKTGPDAGTEYMTMCFNITGGCESSGENGPYTAECLFGLWADAGCFTSGLKSPSLGKNFKKYQGKNMTELVTAFEGYKAGAGPRDEGSPDDCYGCGLMGGGTNFISGGKYVFNREHIPWVVGIRLTQTECAGAIIHPKWVITSATCGKLLETNLSSASVFAGHTFEPGARQRANITQIYFNPSYVDMSNGAKHDIALLELDRNFTLKNTLRPICLPNPDGASYTNCYYAGFGPVVQNLVNPSHWLSVNGIDRLLSDEECANATSRPWVQNGGVICAEASNGGQLCKYDLGDPLMCNQGDNNYVLAGVSTFTVNDICDKPGEPIGFAQIDEHLDWILDTCGNCT